MTRKEAKPGPKGKAAAGADEGVDRSLEIETTHATGKIVTITSDAEHLIAECIDLFYDAKAKLTVLKGGPKMVAIKEGNTLHAPNCACKIRSDPAARRFSRPPRPVPATSNW